MRRPWLHLALLGPIAFGFASCGGGGGATSSTSPTSSGSPPASTSATSFQGVIAGADGQTGTLTVSVQAQVVSRSPSLFWFPFVVVVSAQTTSVPASGTINVSGSGATPLTGTYDSLSRALTLSGGGFAVTGSAASGVMTGRYTGSNNSAGVFATRSTAGGTVSAYCGSIFQGNVGLTQGAKGVFNLAVSDASGAVSGAFRVPDNSGFIVGQVTGTSLSLTYTDPSTGQSGTASGTVQNGTVNGVSQSGDPFSGSRCQ